MSVGSSSKSGAIRNLPFKVPGAALFSTLCDRNEPYHGFSGAPYDHLFSGKCALYERRQLSFGFTDGVDLHSANLADQTRGFSELALLVLAEVYGFLPPHPHNPPTKRPLVQLMKQARAFGVGVLMWYVESLWRFPHTCPRSSGKRSTPLPQGFERHFQEEW
jgi:hypothetical protein